MDTGHPPAPTAPDSADDGPATIEQAAAPAFAPLPVEMPDRARFMNQAEAAFGCVLACAAIMTQTPDALAAVLKRQGEVGFVQLLEEIDDCREWFSGFVRPLDAVEARSCVAGARVPVEAEARP